jgi:hypothetical protein
MVGAPNGILSGRQLGQTAERGGTSVRAGTLIGAHAIATSMHPMHNRNDIMFCSDMMSGLLSFFFFGSLPSVALKITTVCLLATYARQLLTFRLY